MEGGGLPPPQYQAAPRHAPEDPPTPPDWPDSPRDEARSRKWRYGAPSHGVHAPHTATAPQLLTRAAPAPQGATTTPRAPAPPVPLPRAPPRPPPPPRVHLLLPPRAPPGFSFPPPPVRVFHHQPPPPTLPLPQAPPRPPPPHVRVLFPPLGHLELGPLHQGFYGVQKSQNQLQSQILLFFSIYTIKSIFSGVSPPPHPPNCKFSSP